ncbi:Crp/Fnr family transcriptional regulator [Tropicimonas aquimaris]|uniref:Crp/Fnr family transcriptional regulator n=1 Tax=Tropicimonas aquimaris TaxID=914152 RepID=A0ABW3IPJ5_9RHOB
MSNTKIDEARVFLKRRGWLSGTPSRFADALLARCQLRSAERGVAVYRIGAPYDGLYGVVSGGFAFEIAPYERGPSLAHFFRPGFWFGEAEIFDARPQIATIVATRDSTLVHLSLSELRGLIAEEPETWRWIGQLCGQHLELTLGVVDDQMLRDPGERITAILLRLADVRQADNPEDPNPEIDVTQSDLAQLANLSRAAVVSKLQALEREGRIARSYGRVTLLDTGAMRSRLAISGE